jgi:hypothetical protein
MASEKTHEPDDIIKRLAPDPAQLPDVVSYVGFLGDSTRDGYHRLYFSSNLTEYVEFSKADVVASQRLPADQTPLGLGGTLVWLRREATVLHSRTVPIQAQASFLAGDISAAFLRGAAGQAPTGGPMANVPWTYTWCTIYCTWYCSYGCTWRCGTWWGCFTWYCWPLQGLEGANHGAEKRQGP